MSETTSDWVARRVAAATADDRFTLLTRVLPPLLDGCDWFVAPDPDDEAVDVAVPAIHAGVLGAGSLGPEPVTLIAPPALTPQLFPSGERPDAFVPLLVDTTVRAVEILVDTRGTLQMDDFEVSIAVVNLVSTHFGQPQVEPVLSSASAWIRRVADRADGREPAPAQAPDPTDDVVMGSRAAHVLVALLCGPDPVGTRLRGEAELYRRLAHRS